MKRRKFIQKTLMGTAGLFAIKHYPGYSALSENKNKKIKVGLIGAGWYGMVITEAALKTGDVEVVAVCDVDSEHLKSSADKFEILQGNRPKEFKYYQDLLDVNGLEAVFIGSVPHWHALHFVAACEKGLDIYCEKPLSYDVEEGKAMVAAAKKAGNIVQIGFQRRQSKAFAKAKELIQDGEVGKVYQIKAQIHYNPSPGD
ncbi:MAG: Gfo/Idh/MocA family oxidoreductase, partial [Dysgonamonadaceae bacterium]